MKLLAVENLSRSFSGLKALSEVSFDVEERSITALIGPNGAGKTTCFNLIAGVLAPSSGRVRFRDRELHGLAPEEVCTLGVARTFQVVRPLAGMTVIVVAAMRSGGFGLVNTFEGLVRTWNIDGQSVRPDHRMVAHTGFIVTARKLGTSAV